MRLTRSTFAVAAIALTAIAPVVAHHSFAAEYDQDKPLKLTGAVTRIEWMNPHAYFYIDVKDPASGRVAYWAFEMAAPAVLQRFGWKRSSMKIGDMLIVEGWAAKDGAHHGTARVVTLAATGQRLGAAPSVGDGDPRR
ncbi:MAG TPA: DUF6152 family protein [Vicinamibacterales bacterium]